MPNTQYIWETIERWFRIIQLENENYPGISVEKKLQVTEIFRLLF